MLFFQLSFILAKECADVKSDVGNDNADGKAADSGPQGPGFESSWQNDQQDE